MDSRQQNSKFFALDVNVRKQHIYPNFSKDILGIFAQTCQKAEAETALPLLLIAAVTAEPESYEQNDEAKDGFNMVEWILRTAQRVAFLKTYVEQKTSVLEKLCAHAEKRRRLGV